LLPSWGIVGTGRNGLAVSALRNPTMLMAGGEVRVFFENDGPARRLWAKLHQSGNTRSGNREVGVGVQQEMSLAPRDPFGRACRAATRSRHDDLDERPWRFDLP
jgi:hypothetical protein